MTSDIIKEPTAIEDTIEVTSEQVLAGHKEWRTEDHREPCYVAIQETKDSEMVGCSKCTNNKMVR